MRGRSALSILAISASGCVCLAADVVFQSSITTAQCADRPASRLEPGHYAGLSVLFVELVATAFEVDQKQVTIDPAFQRPIDTFDVVVTAAGADEPETREALGSVIGAAFRCHFEVKPDTIVRRVLRIEDPAKLQTSTAPAADYRLAFNVKNREDIRFDFTAHRMTLSQLAEDLGGALRVEPDLRVEEDPGFEYDFECLDCNQESLLRYLRQERGIAIKSVEVPTRSVRVLARDGDTELDPES